MAISPNQSPASEDRERKDVDVILTVYPLLSEVEYTKSSFSKQL